MAQEHLYYSRLRWLADALFGCSARSVERYAPPIHFIFRLSSDISGMMQGLKNTGQQYKGQIFVYND